MSVPVAEIAKTATTSFREVVNNKNVDILQSDPPVMTLMAVVTVIRSKKCLHLFKWVVLFEENTVLCEHIYL